MTDPNLPDRNPVVPGASRAGARRSRRTAGAEPRRAAGAEPRRAARPDSARDAGADAAIVARGLLTADDRRGSGSLAPSGMRGRRPRRRDVGSRRGPWGRHRQHRARTAAAARRPAPARRQHRRRAAPLPAREQLPARPLGARAPRGRLLRRPPRRRAAHGGGHRRDSSSIPSPATDAAGRARRAEAHVRRPRRQRAAGSAAPCCARIEADAAARGIREIVLETGDLQRRARRPSTRRHGYREIAAVRPVRRRAPRGVLREVDRPARTGRPRPGLTPAIVRLCTSAQPRS